MKTFDIIAIIITIVIFLITILIGVKKREVSSLLAVILSSFVISYSLVYVLLLNKVLPIDVSINNFEIIVDESKIYLNYIFFSISFILALVIMMILRKIRLLFKGKFMALIDTIFVSFSIFFIITFIHYSLYKSGIDESYFDSLIKDNEFLNGFYSYLF